MSSNSSSGRAIRGALIASVVLGAAACAGGDLVNEGVGESGGTAGSASGGLSGQAGSAGAAAGIGGAMAGTGPGVGGSSSGGTSSGAGGQSGGTSVGGTTSAGGGGATAGTTSAGGTSGSGGSGNCTDTPPPNGDTCENAVAFGWCEQDWLNGACAASCGTCSGGSGGSTSTGGTTSAGGSGGTNSSGGTFGGGGGQPPRIDGGSQGWASRYWDCCKPACGWQGNVQSGGAMKSCDQQNQPLSGNDDRNACESGGSAYMCWSGVPWAVSDTLAYGFAAASGDNYRCGRCYQLQFNGTGHHGNNAGAVSLNGKTMIVQVINNGGVAGDQFDILIPGGGVGDFNACSTQWDTSASDLGAQYGGFLLGCNGDAGCVRDKCNTIFAGKPDLMRGCDWFLGWYAAADNPNVTFQPIACPEALEQASGLQDPG